MTAEPENDSERLERLIKSRRRLALVVNTHSRRGASLYSRAKALLAEKGVTVDPSYPVRDASRLRQIVKDIVEQGHKFVAVGGGDGTISAVVGEIAYRDVALGVLPMGTANSFARTIGIPLSIAAAVDVLIDGKLAEVDLGKINQDFFANTASIGLPATVARSMRPTLKRYLGTAGYLLVATGKLITHKPFRCALSCGGKQVSLDALDIIIANGCYHAGVPVAPDAEVDSRDLAIRIVRGASKWRVASAWLRSGLGLPPGRSLAEVIRTREATIDTDPKQYVAVDGEVLTRTPIRLAVAPGALKLMVPRDFA